MTPFLYRIAEAFYKKYGTDIQRFHFVFPNKRGGIFFQKYLIDIIEKPLFSPEIITINHCFERASEFQLVDKIDALFRLFDIYKKLSKSDESFDSFVYWGEQLLSDFNEVDNYLVEADQLFTNLQSLNELNNIDYLTETQKKAIERFWNVFVLDSNQGTKKEFLSLWKLILPIYQAFNTSLAKDNLATEGMIAKKVVEDLKKGVEVPFFESKKFVFIGFNALTPSQKSLFEELKKRGVADFYWDYQADELKDKNNPASKFYKQNTKTFSSYFQIEQAYIPIEKRQIELISVPSDIGQTKEVYRILDKKIDASDDFLKTAIILPNENLLRPLLTSVPNQFSHINITMGLPLAQTSAADLMEHIFELHNKKNSQNRFYHHSVNNIINHPYISEYCADDIEELQQKIIEKNLIYISEKEFQNNSLLQLIFQADISTHNLIPYLLQIIHTFYTLWKEEKQKKEQKKIEFDYLYSYESILNRIDNLLKKVNRENLEFTTLIRIIKQLVTTATIPFEGEPLDGLQIMGRLETRGIDFDRLIICSFNEGVFPRSSFSNSFIPYQLRVAFGLQTSELYDAIQTYDFYRLISRAKEIYFIYDARTDGLQSGDISRFGKQLQYYYKAEIKKRNLSYDVKKAEDTPLSIEKTDEIMTQMNKFIQNLGGKSSLSASAINTYINCPVEFYFNYVKRLNEPDELSETIEADVFGSITHKVLENVYNVFLGKVVEADMLEKVIKNHQLLKKEVLWAFNKLYYHNTDKEKLLELDGYLLLVADIIQKYVIQVLKQDKRYAPFTYLQSEKEIKAIIPIQNNRLNINVKGFIDRVDSKEGVLRILDYKSGAVKNRAKSLESAFDKTLGTKRSSFVLQTFFYCLLYKLENPNVKETLKPSLLYIKKAYDTSFDTDISIGEGRNSIKVDDYSVFEKEYNELLTKVLEEIFNKEIPFTGCENEYCPYCNNQSKQKS